MFSKILVGIDGSEYSRNAVNFALDLSSKYDSDLYLLAIVPSKVHHGDSSGVFGMVAPSYFQEYKKEAEKWFEEINKRAEEKKVQIKTEVVFTVISIVEGILTYAEKENINLIIIGSKGKSGWKKLIVGSVASGISTYAHCPILIVK